MGKKFEKDTLKKFLQLAIARIEVVRKKKSELNKKEMALVAALVAEQNVDSAILKVEAICRDDMTNEAYDIIRHNMDIIVSRISLLESTTTCEQTILQPVMLLIWAESRIRNEIPEIVNIVKQFEYKFGKQFIMNLATTQVHLIPKKVYKSLTTIIPPAKTVDFYLKNICSVFNVAYETPEELSLQILSQSVSKINTVQAETNDAQGVRPTVPTTQPKSMPFYDSEEFDAISDNSRGLLKRVLNKKSKKESKQIDENFGSASDQSLNSNLNTSMHSNFGYLDTPTMDDTFNSSFDASGCLNNSRPNALEISGLRHQDYSDGETKKKPINCGQDDDHEYSKKKPLDYDNDDEDEYKKKKPLSFVNDTKDGPPKYVSQHQNMGRYLDEPAPPQYDTIKELNHKDPAPSSHSIAAHAQFDSTNYDSQRGCSSSHQVTSHMEEQQTTSDMDDQLRILEEKLAQLYPHKK